MGQKVRPSGFRVGITRNWDSIWFSNSKNFASFINQDVKIREVISSTMKAAGISKIEIERFAKKVVVNINASRPGVVIGKKGEDIEKLKVRLEKLVGMEVRLNIVEIKKPEVDALLVAESIASQLEKRVNFRRAVKKAMQGAMKFGAKGIRVNCAGRLGGADIARTEWYRNGRVPLHNLRANIDYALAEANTTYGIIGVKVWIFKGEVYNISPVFLGKKIN